MNELAAQELEQRKTRPFTHHCRWCNPQQLQPDHHGEYKGDPSTDGADSDAQLFRHSEALNNGSPKANGEDQRLLESPRQTAGKDNSSRKRTNAAKRREKPLPSLPIGEPIDDISVTYFSVSESSYLALDLYCFTLQALC